MTKAEMNAQGRERGGLEAIAVPDLNAMERRALMPLHHALYTLRCQRPAVHASIETFLVRTTAARLLHSSVVMLIDVRALNVWHSIL